MVSTETSSTATDKVMSLMHPVVSEWFLGKFGELTEAQARAVPLIHSKKSVLVSSPTGSGKTLTAFLSILNELILLSDKGQLEDRIYALYVSPLKALANDINENLLRPLAEISDLFRAKGLTPPEVRVAVRTGDTLQSERQRQARTPPHIFITTPESLSIILSTPVFRKRFEKVDYVIVDEVHEVCDSKRGVALSLALERLQSSCPAQFVRIGLSATVAPIDEVAEFLAGLEGGRPRDMSIVEIESQRDLNLSVICPAKDMTALSFEVVNSKMYDLLKQMIESHRTTLVFTNTRSGTESVVYKLKERGLEQIGAHHGSLSRETRLDVEKSLRDGQLKAVVSSTSLELGIDIGSIDLVVQIGSPKSVAKGLQRVGRAGHQYGGTSKGRIVVFENDDLVECAVLCRAAHRKAIDRVTIPKNSLDVLAQSIVGMSIERVWKVDEAYELVRRAYPYKNLSREQLMSVIRYLGGKEEFEGIYSKIWFDEGSGTFGKKRGARMIFYLNQGTIPEESDYKVFSERGSLIGSLSEKFVERLSSGDIFVLGGRSYEFIRTKGTKAFVKSASGRKPTVPSWTGEMLPRSFDLSVMVAEFRREMEERLGKVPEGELIAWLQNEFDVDEGSAVTIVNYFREQEKLATIPTDRRLIIEGYVDAQGNKSAIFHFPFGRRVNDALSRAYAFVLSKELNSNVTVSVTDDCFMLTVPKDMDLTRLPSLLKSDRLEEVLREAVRDSELFAQRFRHTATRSFMILRNYKGKELSVSRQQLRSRRLLDALHELEDFPVMAETYAEILTEVMDLEHAREVLQSIERGERWVEFIPFSSVPSPFAHNIILVGVSDIVLMEDRSMLLRELHRKVLERVLGEDQVNEYQFDPDAVSEYFEAKFPTISSKQDILDALRKVGPMNLFREKGESIYAHSRLPFERLRHWAAELLREGKVRSVWIGEDVYVASEDQDVYAALHQRDLKLSELEERIIELLFSKPMSSTDIASALGAEKDAVRESLRRLEMANRLCRVELKGDVPSYAPLPMKTGLDRRRCAIEAVLRHVTYHTPITAEDVAYEVGISEQEAEEALRELMSQEVLVSGRFVVGESQQFMHARDYLRLQSLDMPSFDRETVRAFTQRKHFERMDSIEELFDKYGEMGMAYDIFQRVKEFDMTDLGRLRSSGELLLGRFVRGRLRYVMAKDVPHYIGVYRREGLNKYESSILRTIRRLGSGTYQEIAEASGLPSDIMRENFDSLDRKGYLLRLYDEAESWSSRNVYVECGVEPETENPYARVLQRYLRGFGPVTALQAAAYLDLEVDQARELLRRAGAKTILVGLEKTEMHLLEDELESLEASAEPDESVRVLSLYDPFLSDKWTEVTSRFGEGWIFPVVKGGRIIGMIEKWLMAGSVEVREILVDDMSILGEVIDAFDSMMDFYRSLNVDILRVRSVCGIEVDALSDDVRSEFTRRGYAVSNGMLVKGRLVTPSFTREELLDVVFSLQNFEDGEQLESTQALLERSGGLRTDLETILRVRKFEQLQKLHRNGEVVRGHLVPDRVGYCTLREAGIYRAARAYDMTDEEKLTLRVIKDQQPIRRERLMDISPLGHADTVEAIKSLYLRSQIYLDGSLAYVSAPRNRISRQNAWLHIFRRIFSSYGIISAESLSALLGHEIPMRELRRYLRLLEGEGFLLKGYLLRGSGTLYWATAEAFDRLGRVRPEAEVVLSPADGLVLYLRAGFRDLLPETGRRVVFSGSRCVGSFEGAVKNGRLIVEDLRGEPECERIVARYAKKIGLAMQEKEEGRIPDWEIMDFYQKTHPGST